ncbi:MAG: ParB/RepB/Spo0J family partition protein [Bacteroidota bacterium]
MTTKRSALGRGLSALLDNDSSGTDNPIAPSVLTGSISAILLSHIETNPFQPRVEFDEAALKELSESIRQQGIIQPITVRKMGADRYQIISGERRYRASKLAGFETIPAYVRIANDQNMLEMALVENIQRENLNALEVAISYQRLLEECHISQEELANKVGKDRTTVTNYLRLLKLPPQIQFAIRDNRITMGHARAIIAVNDVAMQLKIFNDIISQDLSVRKVEELVREHAPKKSAASKSSSATEIEIKKLQDRLSQRFETKTEIKHRTNGSGQVVFSYFSKDDLNRLLELLDID